MVYDMVSYDKKMVKINARLGCKWPCASEKVEQEAQDMMTRRGGEEWV
jgi:hypothetical protein